MCKELNYAIALKSIKYSDYSFPLELFLWDVNRLNCSSFDKGCVKSRLRDCPYSSFQPVLKVSYKNLSVEEVKAFKNLKENKDLVIQKTNKDNTVVILNKNDYISRLNQTINEQSNYKRLHKEEGKGLNYIIHMQEHKIDYSKV